MRTDLVLMAPGGREDCRHAVLDVQVGLLLAPIPEDPQPIRIPLKLAVEVEHVAVGIALAENRHKATDHACEAVAGAVSADQALAGELRCSVKRSLQRERSVLRRRKNRRLAVNRASRSKDDLLHAARAHRLEHPRGGDRVLLEVAARCVETMANVGIGLEMKHPVTAFERPLKRACVENVAFDECRPRSREQVLDELAPAGPKIVHDDDLDSVLAQSVGERAPNKPGTAGNAGLFHTELRA